jgi:peptidoglycan hydrolase-like protein with peptidoglycan-binding domain
MRILPVLAGAALLCATIPGFALRNAPRTGSAHANIRHSTVKKSVHATLRMGMDTERATQIQSALIKSGYLSGSPTGVWDAQSTAAMQKLQSDNGWQTKITPDSRALIKLGLGPQATVQSASNSLPH